MQSRRNQKILLVKEYMLNSNCRMNFRLLGRHPREMENYGEMGNDKLE